MSLTPDQKSILFKDPEFLQQAGVVPKTTETLSQTVNEDDISNQFKALRTKIDSQKKITETPVAPQTPQYSAPKILPTTKGQIVTGLAKGGYQELKGAMDTSETLLKEKAKQEIGKIPGATALVNFIGKKFGISLPQESVADMIQGYVEKKKNLEPGTLLKANTPIEKAAKTTVAVASLFTPVGGEETVASKGLKTAKEGLKLATKGEEKSAAKIAEEFAPKMTTKEKEAAIKSAKFVKNAKTGETELVSNVKTTGKGIFKKVKYAVGDAEKEMANRFGSIVQGAKGKVENVVAGINEAAKQSKSVVDKVAKENPGKIRNTKQIIADIEKNAEEVKRRLVLGKDSSRISAWKAGFETLKESLKNAPKTREGMVQVFRDFNKIASNIKAYEGQDNIIKQSVIAIRDSLRQEITRGLSPEDAAKVDEALLNQHWAIQAISRLSKTGAQKLGKSSEAKNLLSVLEKYAIPLSAGAGITGASVATYKALTQ